MKGDLDGKAAIVTGGANGIGRLDALVTSAGIARSRPFLRTSLDLWQETLAVNLSIAEVGRCHFSIEVYIFSA